MVYFHPSQQVCATHGCQNNAVLNLAVSDLRMETQTQADVDGGKVKIDDQNITVEGADSVTPVSYTHLDVYKRQA